MTWRKCKAPECRQRAVFW